MKEKILKSLETVLERAKNPADLQLANTLHSLYVGKLFEEYDKGLIDRKSAVEEIIAVVSPIYKKILEMEKSYMEQHAARLGFETLTTDTQGHRSAEWFGQTSKLFATGVPSNGFVCAIIHPLKGMAASHRNTMTLDDYRIFAAKMFDDKSLRANLEASSLSSGVFITPKILSATVRMTVHEAFDEFSAIAPEGIPEHGTQILLTGIEYLTDQLRSSVYDSAIETFSKRVQSEGKMPGVTKQLDFGINQLGKPLGILYGGKNHSQYSEPTFYSLSYQ